MKKAFSLAEVLVTLTIVGVVIALTIPAITVSGLNSALKVLYKKAFSTTEFIVSDMIGDDSVFFNGGLYNATSPSFAFCANFMKRVNTVGATNCTTSTVPTSPNFVTSNNIRWFGLDNAFPLSTTASANITVDVDGAEKTGNKTDVDIFKITVYSNGKLSAPSGNATSILLGQ